MLSFYKSFFRFINFYKFNVILKVVPNWDGGSMVSVHSNNEQPGSSPTQSENMETPCDGLVICHNPALTLTLPFAYNACSKNLVCNSGLN